MTNSNRRINQINQFGHEKSVPRWDSNPGPQEKGMEGADESNELHKM